MQPGARVPVEATPLGDSDRLSVTLDAPDLCPRYAAAVAAVTATTSPAWMIDRLRASGVRPISPFVDITNYVLLELGHPMHAFDLATLADSEIRIRRASAGETLQTLDEVERTLDEDMLVIADGRKPQAIAGVMGGALSEVTSGTRTVAFESACFQPASIRRTSKRLGLKTEASARFERGVDINQPVTALRRALALMLQIRAGTIISPVVDRYPSPRDPLTLTLRRARLAHVLGVKVPDAEVARILRGLGLSVGTADDGWTVTAPTFRVDLLREVDLIEEVGRHYGFERIDAAFPAMRQPAAPTDPRVARDHLLRRLLTAAGLSEAVTFGFIESRAASAFAPADTGPVAIANPLSAKFDVLRPSLLPGLVDAVAHNRRHGRRDVALFEIGARFGARTGESRGLGVAWTGTTTPDHWSVTPRPVDFFDVSGLVEQVGSALGVDLGMEPITLPFLVPGQSAAILANGDTVGVAGLVALAIVEGRGAPRQDAVFAVEIDLDRLHGRRDERVRALPRYPAIVRDLTIVVADTLPAEIISGTIQAAGVAGDAPLAGVVLVDRYTGKGVPERSVSLSVRLTIQAADRTLTDAEVQRSLERIMTALAGSHGAIQR
jgi:phenylalanyl-tRNA synthetase beta chain